MVVKFDGGKVLFDSGAVAMHEDCCCGECGCTGTPPAELLIEFAGITGNYCGGFGGNCDDFNAQFIVTRSGCSYTYIIGGDCATSIAVAFEEGLDRIHVVLKTAIAGTLLWSKTSVGFPIDCVTEIPSDIPFSGPSGFPDCVGSSSTCTLSLPP